MAIELRPAHADDDHAVCDVFVAARHAGMPFLPALEDRDGVRAWLRRVIEGGGVTVAVAGGAVAGFLVLDGDHVEHLYVDPGRRRSGVGTRLLRAAMAARPGGLDLWVFQANAAAIAFYERHGFVVAERTGGERNDEREPDQRMVWAGA